MGSSMVKKIDLERDLKKFWKEIGRMMGRKKKAVTELIKNENDEIMRTTEELGRAFRQRRMNTYIGEEENEMFCEGDRKGR